MKNDIENIKALEDELMENLKRLDDMNSAIRAVKMMLKNLTTVCEMDLNVRTDDEYKAINDWMRASKIPVIVRANADNESKYGSVVELV